MKQEEEGGEPACADILQGVLADLDGVAEEVNDVIDCLKGRPDMPPPLQGSLGAPEFKRRPAGDGVSNGDRQVMG